MIHMPYQVSFERDMTHSWLIHTWHDSFEADLHVAYTSWYPPDPINHVYSLPGEYISEEYFTYRSIQIFKIMFRGFIFKNPTKIWSAAQNHALLDLLLNTVGFFISARQKSACWKWFVPQLYQLRRGILEGPALKYFYMIHKVGRICHIKFPFNVTCTCRIVNRRCHIWKSHIKIPFNVTWLIRDALYIHQIQFPFRVTCTCHIVNESCHTLKSHIKFRDKTHSWRIVHMPYQVSNQCDMHKSHRERIMSHIKESHHMCITSSGLRGDKWVITHVVNNFHSHTTVMQHAQHGTWIARRYVASAAFGSPAILSCTHSEYASWLISWLIHPRNDAFIRGTTHSYLSHLSFAHLRVMAHTNEPHTHWHTHPYTHDTSHLLRTWLGVSRDSFLHTFIMSDMCMNHVTHTNSMLRLSEPFRMYTYHGAYRCVTHTHRSYLSEPCCISTSHGAYKWATHTLTHTPLHTRYMQMHHVTPEWVRPHLNESCHIWMSHVTYEWVMSHMNESCHTWMRQFKYEWFMAHMNERCHKWMRDISHLSESFQV